MKRFLIYIFIVNISYNSLKASSIIINKNDMNLFYNNKAKELAISDTTSYHLNNDSYFEAKRNSTPIWDSVVLTILSISLFLLIIYVYVLKTNVKKRTRTVLLALESIKEREHLLSLIYNNTSDFISLIEIKENSYIIKTIPDWIIDRILERSPNYQKEALLNLPFSEFQTKILQSTPQEAIEREGQITQVIKLLIPIHFEENVNFPIVGFKGVVESTIIPIRFNSSISHVLYISRDVTKKRKRKEVISKNEENLRLAIQNMPVMLFAFDKKGDLLVWNKKCEEITGYTSKEIKENKKYIEGIFPKSFFNNNTENSHNHESETSILSKEGLKLTISWIHQSKKYSIPGWQNWGIGINVTLRKKAELDLVKNEQRLRSMTSNLPGMAYRLDPQDDFNVIFASEGAQDIFEISEDDFINGENTLWDFVLSSHHATLREIYQKNITKLRGLEQILPMRVNGKIKWILDRFNSIKIDEKNTIIDGFFLDITDRVESEEKIVSTIIETEDRERKRIAKELHDSLGQKLTTAVLNLNSFSKDINKNQTGYKKLSTGLSSLNSAIQESREIAHNLMPRSIETFGYIPSVQSLIAEIDTVSGIKFNMYDNLNNKRFDHKLEVHLYRVTQEAINNLIKHSQAKNVTIQLMNYKDRLFLTIEDDGVGFDVKKALEGNDSFGVKSMNNRVVSISGNFIIDSSINRGTHITIEIPFKQVIS